MDDDDRIIVDTASAFAEKRLAPYVLEWDTDKHFPNKATLSANQKSKQRQSQMQPKEFHASTWKSKTRF